jgi:hypothetical protein
MSLRNPTEPFARNAHTRARVMSVSYQRFRTVPLRRETPISMLLKKGRSTTRRVTTRACAHFVCRGLSRSNSAMVAGNLIGCTYPALKLTTWTLPASITTCFNRLLHRIRTANRYVGEVVRGGSTQPRFRCRSSPRRTPPPHPLLPRLAHICPSCTTRNEKKEKGAGKNDPWLAFARLVGPKRPRPDGFIAKGAKNG